MKLKVYGSIAVFILIVACSQEQDTGADVLFRSLSDQETGISFANRLTESDSLNYFTYSYLYMGGGVAIGDINNDGLEDIYFSGNQLSNKLYLNKGGLKFQDITASAGVGGDSRWYTGVTMADINGDGWMDIYCSVSGKFEPRRNQLFINNQDGTFSERAAEFGVDDNGNSVQATFFDYDLDGDLDLYVANYPPTRFNSPTFYYTFSMNNVQHIQSDHLYENQGDKFTDVTEKAGLKAFGLSLSATVGDLNNDRWPDLYVSNDFNSPDFMYLNNQDGTFREVVKKATAHTAFYGMGADIGDFNNDGNLDIFQVDMDAQSNRRKKANMASMNPALFWDVVNAGFHYQYMHNCMQMNTGHYEDGVPYFSNVSRITGTSSTDWSWGPLFADFDNDGLKDLFVSNGTRREINNNDFFNSLKELDIQSDTLLQLSQQIPSEKIDNFIFKNKGGLEFEKANDQWGIHYNGFSNGVAYADLDNDGDLELVLNNLDDTASVFENLGTDKNNYLQIAFKGPQGNPWGLGTRVYITDKSHKQMQELTLSRGFQSSVSPVLHFGMGKSQIVDTLKVQWPDGNTQILSNIAANRKIILEHSQSSPGVSELKKKDLIFDSHLQQSSTSYRHKENVYDDFADQVLLPHKMSSLGPALAVGDINMDGRDDYFIGGAASGKGAVFYQTDSGFERQDDSFLDRDMPSEDLGALLFDADEDGDNDLYVVSGGYEFSADSKWLQDRLYINDGRGNLRKAPSGTLPPMNISGSRVYSGDFDKDGDKDLLVLGRQIPGQYPQPAKSYILENISTSGKPSFQLFPSQPAEFEELGMATSAVITDFNNDGWSDIIVVGEWMPIRVFENAGGSFKEVSESWGLGEETAGWWWSIDQGDFDGDGDMDYVLGNNGQNYKYEASEEETFDIFVNDFDRDNDQDIVLSYFNEGKQYPLRGRECSSQQIPGIKQKFKDYASFSTATLEEVYTEQFLESSLHYRISSFASAYMENRDGEFRLQPLPRQAQLSSINQFLVEDFDKDGFLDLLVAGNLYVAEVETPRNDAGVGLFLKGNGKGEFHPVSTAESGFFLSGDVKGMARLRIGEQQAILAARNNDALQVIGLNVIGEP